MEPIQLNAEDIVNRMQTRYPMQLEVVCQELVIEQQQAEIAQLLDKMGEQEPSDDSTTDA